MLTTQPENKNTKKKMMYELNIVLKFLREVRKLKKGKNVDNIPPEEMNLSEFIIAARTKIKGNNMSHLLSDESYQAFTVTCFLQGVNMGKGYSLILNL